MSDEPALAITESPDDRVSLVVVDDAPEVRTMVRAVLSTDARIDVLAEAEDGLQAVRLAQQLRPDVMLVDISMPRLDGIAAAPRILAVSPQTCLVMYTAHEDEGLIGQAMRAGAAAVIGKSSPISELADRILEQRAKMTPVSDSQGQSGRLRQSEERFRLLVEAVEDYAIFMLDPAGVIVSWNSGAERIKGYTASEVIGRHFRIFYPEEKQRAAHPEYELVQALAEGHFEEEGWRVRKDGSLMWASVLITPLYDEPGVHVGFAKVTRDMSERRRLQEQRETDAIRLADLNIELAAANKVLAEAATERSDFLAVTAHELRTPINVIKGSAEILTAAWLDLEEADRNELLGTIASSAARLNRLLNDLLTAAKLESGRMELTLERTRLADLLEDTLAAARVTYAAAPPTLEVQDDLYVMADRDRLAQAVDNLVHNAYRHGRPPVGIVLGRNGDWAEILVRDGGPGVATVARDRLFERYVTGHRSKTTGLGLYIARELARGHHGDAWWRGGHSGDETAFVIGLPALENAEGYGH